MAIDGNFLLKVVPEYLLSIAICACVWLSELPEGSRILAHSILGISLHICTLYAKSLSIFLQIRLKHGSNTIAESRKLRLGFSANFNTIVSSKNTRIMSEVLVTLWLHILLANSPEIVIINCFVVCRWSTLPVAKVLFGLLYFVIWNNLFRFRLNYQWLTDWLLSFVFSRDLLK